MTSSPESQFVRAASAPSPRPPCSKVSSSRQADAPPSQGSRGGCPVVNDGGGPPAEAECPVIADDFDPSNLMPSWKALSSEGRSPTRLGTERVASSIPVASPELPKHQEEGSPTWMYPSERQFYNAMYRKGWRPQEQDMHTVVALHNAVNERSWSELLRWEAFHKEACQDGPKLKRFQGRPKDLSPKARFMGWMGYAKPFDRHDWIIDRCGREVRYVIDFYNAAPEPDKAVALFLDVRPALDSPQAAWDRARMQFRKLRQGHWKLV